MPRIALQDMLFTESARFPFSPSVFIVFPFLSFLALFLALAPIGLLHRSLLKREAVPVAKSRREAVFFSVLLRGLFGRPVSLGSFNIRQMANAKPVFRRLFTEGQGLWGGFTQWHYLLFTHKLATIPQEPFLPHLQKKIYLFVYWRLQIDEFVIPERLAHRLPLSSSLRGYLYSAGLAARGLCIINRQHRGLAVMCCCVIFNSCKIKM